MMLRSVEEGISFKIEVFPMLQPVAEDFTIAWSPNSWTTDLHARMEEEGAESYLFVQVLAMLEPVVAGSGQSVNSPTLDEDPESWEDSPLHHEVLETVKVGASLFMFISENEMWINTGDYGARVVEEQSDSAA